MNENEIEVLVVYDSKHGSTEKLAEIVCLGVESVPGVYARLRKVLDVNKDKESTQDVDNSTLIVEKKDLVECNGLIMGSPTRFGNMSASMKFFIDQTLDTWISGHLINKPAGVFTSTGSLHGGQETTLISMMFPLIHHGMIMVGIPYSESDLNTTSSGGTPYGASHVAGSNGSNKISVEESKLAKALGKRIAIIAKKIT